MDGSRLNHFFSILIVIFMFGSIVAFAQNQELPSTKTSEQDEGAQEKSKNANHQFYLGAKVGIAYILGIETNYILQTKYVNRLYLAAAVQSSFIINSVNAGGGIFLGRSGIGIGCRYHHLLWFESEKDSKIQPGYGPELVYNKTIGTKYIINLHAGGIITEGSFFPDISFGVFLPLN